MHSYGRRMMRLFFLGIIALLMLGASAPPVARPAIALAGPALSVNVTGNRHAISADIYGVTFFYDNTATAGADLAFAKAIHLPVNRHGGDATSRYNWKVDSTNSAADWYFMAGNGQSSSTPSGSADALITKNRSTGTKTILTIPIINMITASSVTHCTYPKSVYGDQQSYNPYVHPNGDQCGNGKHASDGSIIADTNPSATDIPNDPSIQKAWVQHLVSTFGSAANCGVGIYEMDNEPSGWIGMHWDIHPQGVGYTELRDRTQQYAAAVKAADPTAQVLGPGDIPPAAFGCNSCGNDGAGAHGGMPFGEWYLQQMAQYQQQHGVRLLDYYSMHYPSYGNSDPFVAALNNIHTFHGWINTAYPGTKLGFDEYNWGSADKLGDAINTAVGLGIYGREGVDLASYWGLDNPSWPVAYAFKMYRDYDGNGSTFGDTSLQSTSDNAGQLAIYGAQRSSDGALTLMIVNRGGSDLTSSLALSGFSANGAAQVYQYSGANLGAITRQPDLSVSASGFSATYPANAITLVVLPQAGAPSAAPTAKTPTATSTSPTATVTGTPTTIDTTSTPGAVAVAGTSTSDASLPSSHTQRGDTPWLLIIILLLLSVASGGVLWWRRATGALSHPAPIETDPWEHSTWDDGDQAGRDERPGW